MWSLVLAAALVLSVVAPAGAEEKPHVVDLQFLSVSDWHAQLDSVFSFDIFANVGGAAALSTYFQMERDANPNTLTLTAGDAYGASPPLSGFFDEEPAVLAMNLMGFDVDTFGNHNFDAGIEKLQDKIDLAEFQYVSANLQNRDDNLSGVKDYEIFDMDGVKVAVIGVTNPEAPELVFPGNFGTIVVTDPIAAANRARRAAAKDGAQVFVAIAHMGVTSFNEDGSANGPLIDFANSVKGFDLIFGDHTDAAYSGMHNKALVVQNESRGETYARVSLEVRLDGERIRSKRAAVDFVVPVTDAVVADQAIVDMLEPFRDALAEAFDGVIGVANGFYERGGGVERLNEVPIGNLVTDSMRLRYATDIAFTNGGGIRATLPSTYEPMDLTLRRASDGYAEGPPYDLVVGDAFAVLPFGNSIVTRDVTGAQLHAVLEHSVAIIPGSSGRFGQISGFAFVYDSSMPAGERIVSVTLDNGDAVLADGTIYSMATNDFVNAGGDGYDMLADGQGTTRELMADVLLDYIIDQGEITPFTEGRIVDLNAG